ncbi:patatin-like phospholipase family protein [Streptomyces sp. ID05-04B]|uniref:patatin-like phospholipase family protein n=1 Tax=unclassified Streptomyces TaxID=2593676 RepID=UPI000D1B50C9|nr:MULTISPECIES: patatin-like phospholipase family protein [unclassified Streptomyces]AVV44676.1 patatin [Streptomyces sp. P3]MDX5567780.1 patatin-like phospholipase family protein [Streptomyces sp. ID05-04B]
MPRRRALVIGCGGTLGFAWTIAALTAVEEQLDWDARTAEVLVGTSAGAEVVSALGSGRSVSDLLAALRAEPDADPLLLDHVHTHPGVLPPVPWPGLPGAGLAAAAVRGRVSPGSGLVGLLPRGRGDARWLHRFGAALADGGTWLDSTRTWLVAADARSGRRVAFGAPGAPTADLGSAIAASWAIPGWFPPVRIGARTYLDGGALSPTSADLLVPLGLDEVVIVAPMATSGGAPATGLSRFERVLRRWMTRTVDAEELRLRAAGCRVVRIEPGARELAAMGPNFMDLRRRPATLDVSLRTAPDRVKRAIDRSTTA